MRYLLSADWHLRDDRPRCRVDDWFQTQKERLQFIASTINEYECPMIVAGDIMDNGANSQALENMIIQELKKADYPIYTIAGNHDLHYHSLKHIHKSTYWVLHQAGVIQHLTKDDNAFITPFQYGEEMYDGKHIAVIHRLVFNKQIPPYIHNGITAQELLNTYSYKLIVSGDNHESFVVKQDDNYIVNPGPLFRQKADEKHKPLYIYYYNNGDVKKISVPYNTEDVQQEYLLDEKERENRFQVFVERIQVSHDLGLSFTDNIEQALQTNEIHEQAKSLVRKAVQGELTWK